jgi:hypothetical protein
MAIAVVCLLSSCFYDVEQELYPADLCDTANVSFSNHVSVTIETYCLSCHSQISSSTIGGGIVLENYSGVKAMADNGRLLSAVSYDGNASTMPKGGSQIPSCDIAFIKAWVVLGAPNN